MEPKIGTLTIDRFRAFRHIRIEGLGRVSLITGKNNTGKSSVLEAIRILASKADPSVVVDILHAREEDTGASADSAGSIDEEGSFPWASLFNGFPRLSAKPEPVLIASCGRQRTMSLSLEGGWFSKEHGKDGSWKWVRQQSDFSGDDTRPRLICTVDGAQREVSADRSGGFGYRVRAFRRPDFGDEQRLSYEFVSPYGGERTAMLGSLWDKVVLADRQEDVIEALRIIDEGISSVSMVGGEEPMRSRTAYVRSKGMPRPVPLRSYGDGLNRLFGIVLSLVNAKDGLLLIDEFENGLHHTVQADVWKAIFKLATRLDVQVVATSHSWDAIEAFQRAASEDPEEGVLVRLSRKGDDIIPTLFRENELAIATRDRIEVR